MSAADKARAAMSANLERVRRVRRTIEAAGLGAWVLRIRGYAGRLIPSDVAAAEALTQGESVEVRLEPVRGDSHTFRERRVIAPLDATSHPHC